MAYSVAQRTRDSVRMASGATSARLALVFGQGCLAGAGTVLG
jgi:hypothetical protein